MDERFNSHGEDPAPQKKESVEEYAARIKAIQAQFKNLATADEAGVISAFQTAQALGLTAQGSEKAQLELVQKAAFARMKALLSLQTAYTKEWNRLKDTFDAVLGNPLR